MECTCLSLHFQSVHVHKGKVNPKQHGTDIKTGTFAQHNRIENPKINLHIYNQSLPGTHNQESKVSSVNGVG